MTMIASSNSVRLLWPEGLMIALAVSYLIGTKILGQDATARPNRVRWLSLVGFLSTASVVLLGSMPSYYTIIAIPVIPAPFAFGTLIFRPRLLVRWARLHAYLTTCVVISALAWMTQFVWLLTR